MPKLPLTGRQLVTLLALTTCAIVAFVAFSYALVAVATGAWSW